MPLISPRDVMFYSIEWWNLCYARVNINWQMVGSEYDTVQRNAPHNGGQNWMQSAYCPNSV